MSEYDRCTERAVDEALRDQGVTFSLRPTWPIFPAGTVEDSCPTCGEQPRSVALTYEPAKAGESYVRVVAVEYHHDGHTFHRIDIAQGERHYTAHGLNPHRVWIDGVPFVPEKP